MKTLLKKLIDEYKKTNLPTVRIEVQNEKIEESCLAELKTQGYISAYSYKVLDDDCWECTLRQKAIDEYAPNFKSNPVQRNTTSTHYVAFSQKPKYSMIKCVCCGKDISREARICPNCGQPTEYKITTDANTAKGIWDFLWLIIGAVVLCAIIG